MTANPHPDRTLTIDDVPPEERPSGTASIFLVEPRDSQRSGSKWASLDERGYVRTLDGGQAYVPDSWRVVSSTADGCEGIKDGTAWETTESDTENNE